MDKLRKDKKVLKLSDTDRRKLLAYTGALSLTFYETASKSASEAASTQSR